MAEVIAEVGRVTAAHRKGVTRRPARGIAGILFYLLLVVWAVVTLGPLLWMVLDSFRTTNQIFLAPIGAPSLSNAANYRDAWSTGGLGRALVVSIGVNVVQVLLCGACSMLIAFALSRGRLPLRNVLLVFFQLGLMIPAFSVLIPLLTEFQGWHLTDSYLGLILVYAGFGLSLGVFLFKGAIDRVPSEYLQAAALDGASVPRMIWSVLMPQLRPTIAAFAILTFLNGYNDFVFSLTLISSPGRRPLPLALLQYSGQYGTSYNLVFAAVTISAIPPLAAYLFLRKQVQQSLALGGRVA